MDGGSEDIIQSPTKGHARVRSIDRRPMSAPRSSTLGPLETAENSSQPPQVATSSDAQQEQEMESSFATTTISSTQPIVAAEPLKDYSYLIEPSIFHPLSHLELPEPLRNQSQPSATNAPLSSLLLSSHLRAAAITAANNLSSTPPTDRQTIFNLWYIRLACLTLISASATQIASQEIKVFGDLTSSFYRETDANEHVVPWELRVLAIRLQALGYNDWRRCLEHFYLLAKEARSEAAKHSGDERKMWKDRLWDLGIRIGSALVEMGDVEGASRHLEGLMAGGGNEMENNRVRTMLALLLFQIGNINAARTCFEKASGDNAGEKFAKNVIEALCLMGDNNFKAATEAWKSLLDEWDKSDDTSALPYARELVRQNMAVCLLYIGKLEDARSTLESVILDDKKAFHSLAFNLCTIYELCSDDARNLKLGVAEKVAELNVELTNASFKL